MTVPPALLSSTVLPLPSQHRHRERNQLIRSLTWLDNQYYFVFLGCLPQLTFFSHTGYSNWCSASARGHNTEDNWAGAQKAGGAAMTPRKGTLDSTSSCLWKLPTRTRFGFVGRKTRRKSVKNVLSDFTSPSHKRKKSQHINPTSMPCHP